MKLVLFVLLACCSLFGYSNDCTNGNFSCAVESIKCTSFEVDAANDDEEMASSSLCESTLYLEVVCVISNKTPHDVDLTRRSIDNLFHMEHIYANDEKGKAVRLLAFETDWHYNPKKQKIYTLKSHGRCRVRTRIGVRECCGLYKRLPEVRWQMQNQERAMMCGWIRTGGVEPSHTMDDATRFEVELTFPKVLSIEKMGAFPRKWRDPKTGIDWTYKVFRNEVVLGGGDDGEAAIAREITGAVEIPEKIDGMPVTVIGTKAFMLCEFESVHVPPSVRSIEYSAFEQCWALKELSMSSKVTDIAESAFKYCHDLVVHRY